MKSITYVLVVLICGLLLPQSVWAEETVSPDSTITPTLQTELFIKVTPEITQKEYRYFIEIKGTTNLPDQAIIKATFYYAALGKQKLIDMKYGWVKEKAYNIGLGPYDVRPPWGNYSGWVEFNPVKQMKVVKKALGEVQALKTSFTLSFGTPQEIEQARDKTLTLITEQARKFRPLFNDLTKTFKQYSAQVQSSGNSSESFNQTAWQKWFREFEQRVDTIIRTTFKLDPFRVFDMVTRRKAQIEGICHRLRHLAQACNNALTKREEQSATPYEKILNEFSRFELRLKEELGLLGVSPKLNQAVLEEGFKLLEDRMANLKNKVESVQQGTVIEMAEYNTLMNNWPAEVGAKIFILSKELPVKSYSQISELSTALIGLLARFKEVISNPSNDSITQFEEQLIKTNRLLEQFKNQYLNSQ